MDIITKRIYTYIQTEQLITPGDKILLLVSAGKDSMALCSLLLQLITTLEIDLHLFHLNHGMRGSESDEDEKFLKQFSIDNKVPIIFKSHDFNIDSLEGQSFEEKARNIRYDLAQSIAESKSFNKIATAHSMSDNIETIIMRIFSGTALHGLQGIPVKRNNIIRPILCLSSEEIYSYLESNNIPWREDSSNKDSRYLRNFIRQEAIPLIKKRFPNYMEALSHLSESAYDNNKLLNDLLYQQYGSIYSYEGDDVILYLDKVKGNKSFLQHSIAKIIRDEFNRYVKRRIIQEIMRKLEPGKSNKELYIIQGLSIKKQFRDGSSIIRFSSTIKKQEITREWEYNINIKFENESIISLQETGYDLVIKFADYAYFEKHKDSSNFIFLQSDSIQDGILIRNRRQGDSIRLDFGTKKIKEIFIEKKLDNEAKDCVPLIINNTEIAACAIGFTADLSNRISKNYLVKDKSKKILAIMKVQH